MLGKHRNDIVPKLLAGNWRSVASEDGWISLYQYNGNAHLKISWNAAGIITSVYKYYSY